MTLERFLRELVASSNREMSVVESEPALRGFVTQRNVVMMMMQISREREGPFRW